jgi:uridine kinase
MRDVESMGSRPEVAARYERRYLPGQALYRQDAAPADHADIVVDNSDLAAPRVLRWRVPVI